MEVERPPAVQDLGPHLLMTHRLNLCCPSPKGSISFPKDPGVLEPWNLFIFIGWTGPPHPLGPSC